MGLTKGAKTKTQENNTEARVAVVGRYSDGPPFMRLVVQFPVPLVICEVSLAKTPKHFKYQ